MIKTRQGRDQIRWCLDFNSTKYKINCNEDYIPLWIADSDLALPRKITRKIVKRAQFPYYGYQNLTNDFKNAVLEHTKSKGFKNVSLENIVFTPGTVFTASTVLQAYTKAEDKVMMSYPIYHPLFRLLEVWKRKPVLVPLKKVDQQLRLDLELIEKEIKIQKPKMYILVSPMNPGGAVLSRQEIEQLLKICKKNHVFLLVDEIHGDLPLFDNQVISFVEYIQKYDLIVCTSGNKTYNLAGIQNGWAITKNKAVSEKLLEILELNHVSTWPNIFAQVSYAACWQNGEKYLAETKKIFENNFIYLQEYFKNHCPELEVLIPEATFLVYVDFSKTKIGLEKMREILTKEAKVLIQYSDEFVDPKGFHFRINVAANPKIIAKVAQRICDTVNKYQKK